VLVFQVVQLLEKPQVGHRRGVLARLGGVKLVKNSYIELLGACIFSLRWQGRLDTRSEEEAARWGGEHGRDEGTTSSISAEA
jgi:hypothetical protein